MCEFCVVADLEFLVQSANGLGLLAVSGKDHCQVTINFPGDTVPKWVGSSLIFFMRFGALHSGIIGTCESYLQTSFSFYLPFMVSGFLVIPLIYCVLFCSNFVPWKFCVDTERS